MLRRLGRTPVDASVEPMDEGVLKAFGANVRRLRKAIGASQEGFARDTGMDRAYFGRVERGTQNVSLLTAARIAAALDVELAALLVAPPPSEEDREP